MMIADNASNLSISSCVLKVSGVCVCVCCTLYILLIWSYLFELLVMIASFAVFPHTSPLTAEVSGWDQVE